jgi:hypothetical protein
MERENVRPSWTAIWEFRGVPGFPQETTERASAEGEEKKEGVSEGVLTLTPFDRQGSERVCMQVSIRPAAGYPKPRENDPNCFLSSAPEISNMSEEKTMASFCL